MAKIVYNADFGGYALHAVGYVWIGAALRKADERYASARHAASSLPLAEKLHAIRAAKAELDAAYADILEPRHANEQAIARDLNLCDLVDAVGAKKAKRQAKKAKRQAKKQRKACLAQIKKWNKEDGLDGLSDDELLKELSE